MKWMEFNCLGYELKILHSTGMDLSPASTGNAGTEEFVVEIWHLAVLRECQVAERSSPGGTITFKIISTL